MLRELLIAMIEKYENLEELLEKERGTIKASNLTMQDLNEGKRVDSRRSWLKLRQERELRRLADTHWGPVPVEFDVYF